MLQGSKLKTISVFCAEVSGWLVIPMMVSIFMDALLRGFFNIALLGIVESNSLLLVTLVYMGLAGAQASGSNFRLTLITERLSKSTNKILIIICWLFVLVVLGILSWFCINAALFSYGRSESSYGLVDFPLWPSRIIVAFGLVLLWLQAFIDGLYFFINGKDPFSPS